jgi:acetylornithine/LysW-gamma-L-lysine aminotransferase
MTTLTAKEIYEIESAHTTGLYGKQPIIFVRGSGANLWDIDKVEYLDCTSGHGAANLGYAHPKIAAALAEQSTRLITLFETYYNDQRAALMQRITGILPGLDRVFFCNSGTEATEAAIKFARISTGRSQIIATMRAFHGRTLGALSATYNKKYRQGFEPLVPGFSHVPFNNIAALESAITDETAAFIVEIIQGEGGVYVADPAYIQAARRICTIHGALLIVDEVQTGFCRTGQWFAVQHTGVTPDLLCCAKSLAGGVPMGAVLIGPAVKNLTPGCHGSTFGGNPLACAAGVAALDAMKEEELSNQAAEKGAYLMQWLKEIQSPLIREVRGLGLMVGIELKQKVQPYIREMQSRHILVLNAGMTVIRLLPPLVITYAQIDTLVDQLAEVLSMEQPDV